MWRLAYILVCFLILSTSAFALNNNTTDINIQGLNSDNKTNYINLSTGIANILKDPLFILISGALGTIFGYLLKAMLDIWTNVVKQRQDLEKHVMEQIEKMTPDYYLMSNYSERLSASLNQYIEIKHKLLIMHIEPGSTSLYNFIYNNAEEIAKEALFDAGKLYRVMTDRFWIKGGEYFLPDKWANRAILGLHNDLMRVLRFDPNILLKYICTETQQYEFYEKLRTSESDDTMKDLRDEYTRYQEWLLKEDKEVKDAVAYARAYSNLFIQQMERLYKDWFERGLFRKPSNDPLDAPEIKEPSSPLLAETRELIKRAAKKRKDERQKQSRLINEITDPIVIAANEHLNLGWNYYRAGLYNLAIEEYHKSKDKQPTNPIIYNNLGNAYASKGDYEKSGQMFEKALSIESKDPVFHANFGWMWYKQGNNYDEAIKYYEKAINFDPSNPSNSYYYTVIGHAYSKLEKWDNAVQAYSQSIVLNPSNPVLYNNLALAYYKQGKYDMAIEVYQKAIELATDKHMKAKYYDNKGIVHIKFGKWEEAVKCYEHALELDDKNSEYAMNLISALKQSDKEIRQEVFDKAIETCQKAIQLNPNDVYPHYFLGLIYFCKQDYEMALYEYGEAAHLAPDNFKVYYNMGSALFCQDDIQRSLDEFQEAFRLNPEFAFTSYNIGNCYYLMEYTDMAKEKWQESIRLNPRFAKAFYNLGVLSYKQGDKESALRCWQKSVTYDEKFFEAYHNLGVISFENGDTNEALYHWHQTLKIASKFEPTLRILEDIKQGKSPDIRICDIKGICDIMETGP